ncbi:hypothetical protein H0H93_004268, partial [Arthromyces matolae]
MPSAPLLTASPLRGRRIQVVGHAGAGKSTFSIELGTRLQVPVIHLDPIFWSEAWVSTPAEEVGSESYSIYNKIDVEIHQAQAIVRQHAAKEAWVIDGNQWVPLKDITYPRATDIIWIDPPFYVWFYRLISRALYKALTIPGSFYRDFLDPKTSIIFQAFRLRKKKMENWNKMIKKDERWQR